LGDFEVLQSHLRAFVTKAPAGSISVPWVCRNWCGTMRAVMPAAAATSCRAERSLRINMKRPRGRGNSKRPALGAVVGRRKRIRSTSWQISELGCLVSTLGYRRPSPRTHDEDLVGDESHIGARAHEGSRPPCHCTACSGADDRTAQGRQGVRSRPLDANTSFI
jgi:hypothetical protein